MTNVSAAAPAAGREFRVGHVLSYSLTVFTRNLFTLLSVSVIAALPQLFIERRQGPFGAVAVNSTTAVVAGLLTFVLALLCQAVILHAAFQDMRGRPIQLGESFAVGLRRFLPILGTTIVFSICVGLASLLFLVPGFILLTMWYIAVPVCVVEELGPINSLQRSSQLTKGHRWKIFGILIVVLLIALIVQIVLTALLFRFGGSWTVAIGLFAWQAVWAAFSALLVVVTYHDLRVVKEGIDIHQIASVFD